MKAFTAFIIAALIAALFLPIAGVTGLSPQNTIVVNTFVDEDNDNDDCSLREAISAATTYAVYGGCTAGVENEDNIIELMSGTYTLTLEGIDDLNATGDLDIISPPRKASPRGPLVTYYIYISGAGINDTIIDGNGIDRVFDIQAGNSVELQNLTVTNGQSWTTDAKVGFGGGIYNDGGLILQNVLLSHNTAGRDSVSTAGGGVFNNNYFEMNNSIVEYNQTLDAAASHSGRDGGGLYNTGEMNIYESTIRNNNTGDSGTGTIGYAGGYGGGLFNDVDSYLTIQETTVSGNYTGHSYADNGHGGHGGGIYNTGFVGIESSTIQDNFTGNGIAGAGGDGGGIYNTYTLTMINSTISTNHAGAGTTETPYGKGGSGGGIFSDENAYIYQSTITLNVAGNGVPDGQGGGLFISGTSKLIEESILADNLTDGNPNGPDCYGYLDSPRYNLVMNATNCVFNGSPVGNKTNVDPLLGILKDNGGLTKTHLPGNASPAIDAAATSCHVDYDQRGIVRPIDYKEDGTANCDMGAVEALLLDYFYAPMIFKP